MPVTRPLRKVGRRRRPGARALHRPRAAPARPGRMARRPPDRVLAGPRHGAAQLLRHAPSLTDPVLERRIGLGRGLVKLGPRRLIQPALRKRELPRLDAVLLSHAHMDHTDLGTLRAIPADDPRRRPVRATATSCAASMRWTSSEWGERARDRRSGGRVGRDPPLGRAHGHRPASRLGRLPAAEGRAAPSSSAATPPTPTRSTRLAQRGPVDLAILPIGAYDPWVTSHASPEEAWRMFRALGAEYLLPIHHSTFRLSREPTDEPMRRPARRRGRRSGGGW